MCSFLVSVCVDSTWADIIVYLLLEVKGVLTNPDSLVVAAAEMSGCDEILTEDLNDGQVYGSVKAVNPFKA